MSKTTSPKALTERLQRDFEQHGAARRESVLLVPSRQTDSLPARTPASFTELPYDDDGPLELPTAFRAAPPPQGSWLLQQLKTGIVGFVLGLVVVLPAVLWLSGRLSDPMAALRSAAVQKPATLQRTEPVETQKAEVVAVRPVETAPRAVTATDQVAAIQQPVARPDPEKRRQEEAEALLERAREMIGDGNMLRAREILGDALLADNPRGAFALAETYDPNILAATGARDVRAEVERARTLYAKALAGGVVAAENRLNALK